MSVPTIRSLMETALASALSGFPLAYENVPYVPVVGTAFGAVYLYPGEPENPEMGPGYIQRGIMQVNLFYPLDAGTGAASAKAETIRTAFPFATTLTATGVRVLITRTPEISPARIEADWLLVPVRIRFEAYVGS